MSKFRTLFISGEVGGVLVTDGEIVLIVNLDANNTLYLDDNQSVDVGNPSDSTSLSAGSSIVLDGKTPTYVAAAPGLPAQLACYPHAIGFYQQ